MGHLSEETVKEIKGSDRRHKESHRERSEEKRSRAPSGNWRGQQKDGNGKK